MQATAASTVRPFVTDDARVVYPRQLEMEIFPKLPLRGAEAELPRAVAARGLATDRVEIIAGGFGPVYEHGQVKPWT